MNCQEVVEALADHVEGALTPLQRWRLRIHLWICQHCRNYVSSYKTTLRAEKATRTEEPGDVATGGLVNLIVAAAKDAHAGDAPPRARESDGSER